MEEILDNNYLPLKDNENFSKLASTLLFGDIEKQWEDGKVNILFMLFITRASLKYTINS